VLPLPRLFNSLPVCLGMLAVLNGNERTAVRAGKTERTFMLHPNRPFVLYLTWFQV